MASKIVAVAGGTGNLGRAIVERLVASGKYKVLVLGREVSSLIEECFEISLMLCSIVQASESKSEEIGAEVLAVNYSDVPSIIKTLEDNKIDTLISTLGSMSGVEPEMALIEAAGQSKVTKRYIPSTWGVKYTDE